MEKANLDLANYRAIQEVQAEHDKIRLEAQARQGELEETLSRQRERDQLDMALKSLAQHVLLARMAVVALIVGIGLAYLLIQTGRRQLVLAQSHAAHVDPWNDPTWRGEQVPRARVNEIAGQQTTSRSIRGGNGQYPSRTESVGSLVRGERILVAERIPFRWSTK